MYWSRSNVEDSKLLQNEMCSQNGHIDEHWSLVQALKADRFEQRLKMSSLSRDKARVTPPPTAPLSGGQVALWANCNIIKLVQLHEIKLTDQV